MMGTILFSFRSFGWLLLLCSLLLVAIEASTFLQIGEWEILSLGSVLDELGRILGAATEGGETVAMMNWPAWSFTTMVGAILALVFVRRI